MTNPKSSSVTINGHGGMKNRKNISNYSSFWSNDSSKEKEEEEARKSQYMNMVNGYYDGVTELYEYGWGQCFHFSRYYKGEPFAQGLARHEHYLAAKIGITRNMRVLDVGSGVGGPAREICHFTGANIVGVNNNLFQIDRARKYAAKVGLADKVTFEQADFTQMSSKFGENAFDAVFSIEATCHAPVAESVYGEVFKVLKPGCIFGFYEWCLTDKYNDDDSFHRRIRREIELGDALPELRTIERAAEALRAVGFEIIESDDLATRDDLVPWYYPIRGKMSDAQTLWDYFTMFRLTTLGKGITSTVVKAMELVGLAHPGTAELDRSLNIAAKALVQGGETGIFTPMNLFICRKPL
ncbi:hypothetical protein O181_055095 [Austropuccinia psidii MF-1]|uniref:SAM-dependent methyltransferase Erg6/SMT-type domain-containing protein n=1 Tax=Austropuccinia psidii MF-1 TaxID=1389203 RepID=A0A9Q3HUY3_9BASI|nr:hypothetical protein [Austropuccinia psidii MF-1]